MCFDPSNVLGFKRSPCSLEMMTYFAACQCFCKSRSTFFVLIPCLYSVNLFPCALFAGSDKQDAAPGEPVTRGCSVPEHPAPASLSARQPPLVSLAQILPPGFEYFFTCSAVRIMKKQGQKIKSKVCATAEAIWAVLDRMLVGLFPS